MDRFSRHELTVLLEQPRSHCVSMYLPTHRAGPETQQDPIGLTNLVHSAEEKLVATGERRADARDLLRPARALMDDAGFWRYRGDGVGVFLRAGWWRAFRLPLAFESLVAVSDRFHVFPLLPLLTGDGRFFLLALSENEVRLLSCTRSGAEVLTVPDMPRGVQDALRYDELQRQRGHHSGQGTGANVRTILHGQGIGAEVQKERLGRYLQTVHHAVRPALRGQHAPLVLAGVDHIRAAFRDITGYPHVLKAGVPGNPDRVPAADLHARAWLLTEPEFDRRRQAAAARYAEALGTGLATDDPDMAVDAARAGRVEVLFLSAGAAPREWERLETAAKHTIRTSGILYTVAPADMPGRAPVAALLRY
ncbi:hypothetical protein ABZ863_12955 [Saccharomonospora sp. NPDC046836]|uniref:baeRF3 domain-containing protein n=1 Tax=Saccharomonospora sp. NPDC046836 TaxID=3156921 RepID=UPI0033C0863C